MLGGLRRKRKRKRKRRKEKKRKEKGKWILTLSANRRKDGRLQLRAAVEGVYIDELAEGLGKEYSSH